MVAQFYAAPKQKFVQRKIFLGGMLVITDNKLSRKPRVVASGGGSGARPPHMKSVPPISRFVPRLLHTSNTVFLKCAPPSGFWPPLLLNPGGGPAETASQ